MRIRLRIRLCLARLVYALARLNERWVRFGIDAARRLAGMPPMDWEQMERDAVFVVDCVPERERAGVFEQMARPGRN